jgi:hypothetical protein
MWDEALRKAREWTYNFTARERKVFVSWPLTPAQVKSSLSVSN